MKTQKNKKIINDYSDPGFVRTTNEDFSWSGTNDILDNMLIVSDGVGSYYGSDLASKIVCKTFIKSFLNQEYLLWDIEDWFSRNINKSKKQMQEYVKCSSEFKEMSTTLVLALILNNKVHIFWIGDSRAYFIENNNVTQLTKDHNLLNYLLKINASESEIKKYENSLSSITNSIDASKSNYKNYDYICINVKNNSLLFLASDGFYNFFEMNKLYNFVRESNCQQKLSKNLVNDAILNGSHDNISFSYLAKFK